MDFRITGLPADNFTSWFGLSDEELVQRGGRRMIVDAKPGYPCRITLEDAEPGEPVILLHWTQLDVASPYRGGGPIFIREHARQHADVINQVPPALGGRTLSVRAFDAAGWMRHGRVVEGDALAPVVRKLFANAEVDYLHVHNAGRGCFAARIDRA